jgi:hypothetical protein
MPSYVVETFSHKAPRRMPEARAARDLEPQHPRSTEVAVAESPLDSSARRRPLLDRAMEPAPMIEEYAEVELVPLTGQTSRWLWLAITLGIAVVGLGFTGHIWSPPPIGVASVESATPPSIGQVPGPNAAPVVALTVLNPAEKMPSEGEAVSVLEVSSATVAGSTSVSLRRSAASGQSGGDARLLVDGYAPSNVEAVKIDIRTTSGSLLASAVVPAGGDERAGSGGRPRVGIGSLRSQLVVPGPIPPDGWEVRITWRDRSNGLLGSVVQRIPAVTLGRNLAHLQ